MSVPKMVLRTCEEIGLRYLSRRKMLRKGDPRKTVCRDLPEGQVWTRLDTLEWVPVSGFQVGSIAIIRLGEQRSAHWGFNWAANGGRFFDLACTQGEARRVAKRMDKVLSKELEGVDPTDPKKFADIFATVVLRLQGKKCFSKPAPRKQIQCSDIVYAFVPEFNLV